MADQSATGVSTDSPTVTDFASYEAAANAADLAREAPPTPSDVTPESSPDPSGKQSASTDAKPAASEPAKPDDKKPHNLDTRHRDVDGKIEELKRKLEIKRELEKQLGERQPAKPAASQPAKPAEPEWKRYAKHPNAPKVEDFDTYEEFVDARADFITDQKLAARERSAQLDAASRERMSETEKTIAGFHERLGKAREADSDFDSKINPGLLQLVPAFALRANEQVGPANVLLQEVVTSEFSNELMLHFSTDEGRAEWHKLISSPHPAAMIRGFGRIEARFESSGNAAEKSSAKTVTSAPAPPRTLGSKPPADPDRAASAVKAGDFSAYEAAENAKDLARTRR